MERLFSGLSAPTLNAAYAYAALVRREFYESDIESASGDFSGVALDKALSSPLSITRITTRAELAFRRGPQHIRKNRAGIRVLLIVLAGAIKIVRATGITEIAAGRAGFVDSSVPFSAVLKMGPGGFHSSYQIIIPPDQFIRHLHEAERLTQPFSLDSEDGQIVREVLEVLTKHGDHLGEKTSELLVQALLASIADHLRKSFLEMPRRRKLVDRRLADIERYIKMNLSDPQLTYGKVAIACGISPRYLCFLLKAKSTSFSELVWKNRLRKARDWLISIETLEYPIREIAYMSGFKSAAHFSRMFKSAYGMPPREFRAQHVDNTASPSSEQLAQLVA